MDENGRETTGLRGAAEAEPWKKPDCGAARERSRGKKPDCGATRERSRGRSRIVACSGSRMMEAGLRRGSGVMEEELWCTVGAGQRENSGLAESTGNVEMEQAVGYVSGIFFVVGDF